MTAIRHARVAEQIQRLLGELIERRVKDPRLSTVSVTGVKLSPSMREAMIYVSALEGAQAQDEVLAGLEHAKGFLRREVGRHLKLRSTPELFFRWDVALERGDHILQLLDEFKEESQEE
jgi:ribosome-binding factor A